MALGLVDADGQGAVLADGLASRAAYLAIASRTGADRYFAVRRSGLGGARGGRAAEGWGAAGPVVGAVAIGSSASAGPAKDRKRTTARWRMGVDFRP